ncbi:MAG: methylmalonyl-CoA mutase family protein [Saprospiraceae bacterium]
MDSFFSDFTPTTKEQWLQQIEKELKGKPFSDLQWAVGTDISVDPFYTKEDLPNPTSPQIFSDHPAQWGIGEQFEGSDYVQNNSFLLQALQGGIDAPGFQFQTVPSIEDFGKLYQEVAPDFVSHHFEIKAGSDVKPEDVSTAFLSNWGQFLDNKNTSGTFYLANSGEPFLPKYWVALANWRKFLPDFRLIGVDLRPKWDGKDAMVGEVSFALNLIVEMLEKASDSHEWSVLEFFQNLHIKVNIGTSYFLEIAKLRALRLCLANLQKAYGLEAFQMPFLDVYFTPQVMDENANTNMIKDTTMAMAAIIGGASRLTVMPANANKETASPFTRRIARNVQHLLAMESNFGKVSDPAAGSYYVEHLTNQIAEKAWSSLQV